MHDFRTLSPLDFEELVRDLLQEELGLRFESFGSGPDLGIDFRFSVANGKAIVRVEHYLDSGTKALLRAARRENDKVAKLKLGRYPFVTSLSLTPVMKSKLKEPLPAAPLADEDILGRADLNNLLGRHPQIEKKHCKLWLASTAVPERILHSGVYNRTQAEMDVIRAVVPKFVQNESVPKAEAILQKGGALIIAGEPGVGKSTLARYVRSLLQQSFASAASNPARPVAASARFSPFQRPATAIRRCSDPPARSAGPSLQPVMERRWNDRLVNVRALEEQLAKCGELPAITLSAEERERLIKLGRDLSQAWYGVGASVETRKKIIRLLIEEIIVEVIDDKVELIIHWQGGDHTRLSVKKNKRGQNRWTTDAQVVEFVQILARHMPDSSSASVLNRSGESTGRGNSGTSSRVYRLRYDHAIEPYRKGERAERGEVNIEEAASALSVSPSAILRMFNEGSLPGKQLCKGAPWIIRKEDIEHSHCCPANS
jgi:hypothetical protein